MIDNTATLQGVTIGDGTIYGWTAWPSGLGTAEIRVQDEARPGRAGLVAGDDLLGGREVVFVVQVKGTATVIEQALLELAAAYEPVAADVWLDLRMSGTPAEYALLGRPRGCQYNLSKRYTHGLGDARCVFVATDPVKYGAEQQVTISLGTPGVGLTYPVTYPIVYTGSALSGIGSAPNDGFKAVHWSAVLNGPMLNPRLEHIESGRFIRVSADLLAGETLTLDSRSGALLFGGTSPRPTWQAPGSSWFQLAPGPNSLRLTADTGTGSADVTWRPGWP